MSEFHLAEINIARMKGVNINDPVMKEFVDNLDKVNAVAESSEGFVWRLKDDSNNATNINPYNDELYSLFVYNGVLFVGGRVPNPLPISTHMILKREHC